MNIPASTASIAMITLRPSKYTAGTSATTPETMSQIPSSNIPIFFEKFMEIFLSLCISCGFDGSISNVDSYFLFSVFSLTITL